MRIEMERAEQQAEKEGIMWWMPTRSRTGGIDGVDFLLHWRIARHHRLERIAALRECMRPRGSACAFDLHREKQ